MKDIMELTLTREQLYVIKDALCLYFRIGMGQFDHIENHPTIHNYLWQSKDYYNNTQAMISILGHARNVAMPELGFDLRRAYSIGSDKISECNRIAKDLEEVIRHHFWKERNAKGEASQMTVDSDVCIRSEDGHKIKVKTKK